MEYGPRLTYEFDDKLALLRQHFLHSDKTTISINFVLSVKVSAPLHETIQIIPNMKKQSSHSAYITSNAL